MGHRVHRSSRVADARGGSAAWHLVLAVQLAISMLPTASASAQSQPLNGSSPRPFYVFAHNPNTLADVKAALVAGANALEPDITRAPCSFTDLLQDLVTW